MYSLEKSAKPVLCYNGKKQRNYLNSATTGVQHTLEKKSCMLYPLLNVKARSAEINVAPANAITKQICT